MELISKYIKMRLSFSPLKWWHLSIHNSLGTLMVLTQVCQWSSATQQMLLHSSMVPAPWRHLLNMRNPQRVLPMSRINFPANSLRSLLFKYSRSSSFSMHIQQLSRWVSSNRDWSKSISNLMELSCLCNTLCRQIRLRIQYRDYLSRAMHLKLSNSSLLSFRDSNLINPT